MVFPSDSSNYRVSYKEGERVSRDEQVTPIPHPANVPPAKDFKKILEKEREKKSTLSKGAKQDDDDEKQVTDKSTEGNLLDNDFSDVTVLHEKITSLPYDSKADKKGKKRENVVPDDMKSPTVPLEGDVDVVILPVFPQQASKVKTKASVESDTEVVIDPDLIKELTEKMTDSFGSQIATKSSTTMKAAEEQPVQKNSPKQTQDNLTTDTDVTEDVSTPVNDEMPIVVVPSKSETKVKTDLDVPHLTPSADQTKRSGEAQRAESPFVLFAAHGRIQREGMNAQVSGDASYVSVKDTNISGKANVSSRYNEEDIDVHTSVIPVGAPIPISASVSVSESRNTAPLMTVEDIDSIVTQIEKMYTISTQGKTDSVIILKHPPLFEGAHVVIKSSPSAPNEFNLSFENLNQAAQKLIESNANQARLSAALDEKGFTVHIITATTLIETFNVKSNESQGSRSNDQGNRGDDSQPDQRQNKKKQG